MVSVDGSVLPEVPDKLVTSALSSRSGDVWVATEGGGLLELPRGGDQWERQKGNNIPNKNNFYALAEDRQGRIWAGTDNQGAAVWNGKQWLHLVRENALLGERVFSISVSPSNGDVAIATSGGISIYQANEETWLAFTRADGLPEDQAASLSFSKSGILWVAFQSHGIGYASPQKHYKDWKFKTTKWYWDEKQRIGQPLEASGKGLPSNFGNAICASSEGVWVGTNAGLGYWINKSEWRFLRGKDYKKKIRVCGKSQIGRNRVTHPLKYQTQGLFLLSFQRTTSHAFIPHPGLSPKDSTIVTKGNYPKG